MNMVALGDDITPSMSSLVIPGGEHVAIMYVGGELYYMRQTLKHIGTRDDLVHVPTSADKHKIRRVALVKGTGHVLVVTFPDENTDDPDTKLTTFCVWSFRLPWLDYSPVVRPNVCYLYDLPWGVVKPRTRSVSFEDEPMTTTTKAKTEPTFSDLYGLFMRFTGKENQLELYGQGKKMVFVVKRSNMVPLSQGEKPPVLAQYEDHAYNAFRSIQRHANFVGSTYFDASFRNVAPTANS